MKKTILALRNIEDLAITIAIVGGLSSWLHRTFPPEDPEQNPFKLLWLIAPSIVGAVIITRGKWWPQVGLRPNLVRASVWYLLALLVTPFVSGVLLLLANAASITRFSPLSLQGQWTMILPLILPLVLKNLFEEFCFRGFLTSRFQATPWSRLLGHFATGGIWALWHLPLWLVFLPASEITALTGLQLMPFVALAFLLLPLQAVFYGELRLRSGSVWPSYLMHVVSNVVTIVLLENYFIKLDGPLAIILTPGSHGILYSLLLFGLGFVMMKKGEAVPAIKPKSRDFQSLSNDSADDK